MRESTLSSQGLPRKIFVPCHVGGGAKNRPRIQITSTEERSSSLASSGGTPARSPLGVIHHFMSNWSTDLVNVFWKKNVSEAQPSLRPMDMGQDGDILGQVTGQTHIGMLPYLLLDESKSVALDLQGKQYRKPEGWR